jgi:hypothetical protein
MVKVLITIDTEVYPLLEDWRQDALQRDWERDILGITPSGEVGLAFQLNTFREYGLKATFFVESLFADAVGLTLLKEIVQRIHEAGQEVQLHLHPEWLAWTEQPCVPSNGRETMGEFSESEQCKLIRRGLDNLRLAGAENVNAFRAGDYAATAATLRSLHSNGITFDTSMNRCYANSLPECSAIREATLPFNLEGVWEVPIAYWRASPFGFRHAQFVSSSLAELKAALVFAYQQQWPTFVIVSHTFELLSRRRQCPHRPRADPVVVKRFVKLCQFLSRHADKFTTCGFHELEPEDVHQDQKPPHSSPFYHTMGRQLEQLYRRVMYASLLPAGHTLLNSL